MHSSKCLEKMLSCILWKWLSWFTYLNTVAFPKQNNSKINSYSSIVQKRTLTTPGIQLWTKYVVPEPNPTKFRGHDMKIGAEQQCMKNPCGLPSRLQPKRLNGRTQNNRGDLDYHHVDWKEHWVGVGGGWNWVRNCREKIKKSKRKRERWKKRKHQPFRR